MSSVHSELIRSFYEAFARRDAATMAASYAEDAVFSDPVFPHLEGREIGRMWTMLCSRATDLVITADDVSADDTRGAARWEARYTFGATGRSVHNRIQASFRFEGGKIVRHLDDFDFYRWSRMAIGPLGWVLGWSPLLRNRVRAQAARGLERFSDPAESGAPKDL